MNKKTLKALRGSIKKWEGIVNNVGVDKGVTNCSLCTLFFDFGKDCCARCPVSIGDFVGCDGTPYEEWREHHLDKHHSTRLEYKNECSICTEIAQKEVDFLISLLPPVD